MRFHDIAVISLAGAVSAIPSAQIGRATDGNNKHQLAMCERAANCEVVVEEHGQWIAKFKDDMGVGSDWYEEHVVNNTIQRRQGPPLPLRARQEETFEGTCSEDTCTQIHIGGDQVNFGDMFPRDFADMLWEQCSPIGCQQEFSAEPLGSGTNIPTPITLKGKPDGRFHDRYRHDLIHTMTEMVGRTAETYIYSRVSGRNSILREWNKANNLYQINVYEREGGVDDSHNMVANLVFKVESGGQGSIGCDTIFSMLGAGLGGAVGWVGGALGVGSAVCGLIN